MEVAEGELLGNSEVRSPRHCSHIHPIPTPTHIAYTAVAICFEKPSQPTTHAHPLTHPPHHTLGSLPHYYYLFAVQDILAICGGRMYVFFLDAAPTERLVSQEGSLRTFLEEEAEMGAEGGGKLRKSILTGANSEPMMATLRAMAIICDTVLWPLLRAVKPAA